MSGFADVYLPDSIRAFPWRSSPRTSTTIVAVASGDEQRNRNWLNPLRTFSAADAVRCYDIVEDLQDHWLVVGGPLLSFPMRDPLDFSSRRLRAPNDAIAPTELDQQFGIGDGVTRFFQLKKTYSRGGLTYARNIKLPAVESCIFAMNGLPPDTANPALLGGPYVIDVSREGGEIAFDHAPAAGTVLTAGFFFDVPVRFESDDSFDRIVAGYQVDGFASLSFMETRFCGEGASS